MKMTKLLAGAAAASLAVTSLATVASAKDAKVFEMGWTTGSYNASVTLAGDINDTVGKSADQAAMQVVTIDIGSNWSNEAGWESVANWNGDVILTVKGSKVGEDGKYKDVTKDYTFTYNVDTGVATIVVLSDTATVYRKGEFAPAYFTIIESMQLSFKAYGSTDSETVYKNWQKMDTVDSTTNLYKYDIGAAIVADWNTVAATNPVTFAGVIGTNKTQLAAAQANGNCAASLLAYCFAEGGYKESTGTFPGADIKRAVENKIEYPVLSSTGNDKQERYDIELLSDTGAYNSFSDDLDSDNNQDVNLSYVKHRFAGFASQVADYFNKQDNGQIVFELVAPAASGSTSGWTIGGIPSTEIGFNFITVNEYKSNDVALFFNYNSTTGSMITYGEIDKDAATITFDMAGILDDFGGLTKASLTDIYYGLTKNWGADKGISVKTVTLKSEDVAVEETEPAETDEPDDVADPDDDIEDDTTVEDDDEPTIVDDDTTTEPADDDVDGDSTVTPADDDDTNPPTGVALAVIPAMIAGAAAIVAKKRK